MRTKMLFLGLFLLVFLPACDSDYRMYVTASDSTRWSVERARSGSGDSILTFSGSECREVTRLNVGKDWPLTVVVVEERGWFASVFYADERERTRAELTDSLETKRLCW